MPHEAPWAQPKSIDAPAPSPFLEAALHYALRGLEVLPCRPGTKIPLTEHGFHDATVAEHQIREWWTTWPDANVACRPRGIGLVLDVDPRNGGWLGLEHWIEDHYQGMRTTACVETGGGGRHLWFHVEQPVKNLKYGQGERYCGIDLISATGYVMMPPSVHPDGPSYDWYDYEGIEMPAIAPLPASYCADLEVRTGNETAQERTYRTIDTMPAPVAELAKVRLALAQLDPSMHNDPWYQIGMAIHSLCWTEGFVLWDTWSQGSPEKYSASATRSRWNSFHLDGGAEVGITVATLYNMADQASPTWRAPLAIAPVPLPPPLPLGVPYLIGNAESWGAVRKADELVEDLVEADTLGVAYGPPGGGKTFWAMGVGMHVALGIAFHGKAVQQGPVVYVCGEGGSGVHTRRKAWLWHQGFREPPTDEQFPFYQTRSTVYFTESASFDPLIAELRTMDVPIKLLIIDTLARTFTGKENEASDMAAWVRSLDAIRAEFRCTVLVVHHSGKDIEAGARGSTALRGAVDWEFLVQDTTGMTWVQNKKQRNTETGGETWYERVVVEMPDADGLPVTSVVLQPSKGAAPVAGAAAKLPRPGGGPDTVMRAFIELENETRASLDSLGKEAEPAVVSRKRIMEKLGWETEEGKANLRQYVARLRRDGHLDGDRNDVWRPGAKGTNWTPYKA